MVLDGWWFSEEGPGSRVPKPRWYAYPIKHYGLSGKIVFKEVWKILKEALILYFEKKDGKYLLTDYRSLER
jgi:hypothetical protein